MTFLRRFLDLPPRRNDLASEEADSIVHNLTQILRSQSGYASFLPDFGLDDPGQHSVTPKSLDTLRLQILTQVERYESRLEAPKLTMLPRAEDGSFRFELSGQLKSGAPLRLIIQMSRTGSRKARLEVRMSE